MLGMHWPELLAVLVVALLVFGPKRLPEMGSAIGKTFKEFKKSVSEIQDSAHKEINSAETTTRTELPTTTNTVKAEPEKVNS